MTTNQERRNASLTRLAEATKERAERLARARTARAETLAATTGDGMTLSDPAAFLTAVERMKQ